MPLYNYKCHDCGATVELLQPITAPMAQDCTEDCGGTMRRMLVCGTFSMKPRCICADIDVE